MGHEAPSPFFLKKQYRWFIYDLHTKNYPNRSRTFCVTAKNGPLGRKQISRWGAKRPVQFFYRISTGDTYMTYIPKIIPIGQELFELRRKTAISDRFYAIPDGVRSAQCNFFIESVPVIRIWPTYQKLSQSVKNFLSYGEKRQFRTVFMRFFGFTAENQNSNRAKCFSVT